MFQFPGVWLRWLASAAVLCAIIGIALASQASHGWIFPDSTSYIEMADNAVHVSPATLGKNAYWSPAYPALLAVMMAIVRPSLDAEIKDAYVVHWLIFVFTTFCFGLLLTTVLKWLSDHSWAGLPRNAAQFKALIVFGFAFFLLANMNHTVWYLTPDMLLQGLVYLAAACALRLFLANARPADSVILGVVLALGYVAKAAMFPVALMLIAVVFFRPPADRLGRRHALLALAGFCLAAAPLVISLSLDKHRLTFGDSGKINYAYHVGDLPRHSGWLGQNPANGVPAHPPRVVSRSPMVLEFRTPVRGTLPIWYDPSYWWEGLRVPFNLQRQLDSILEPFRKVHSRQMLILACFAALMPFTLFSARVRKAIGGGGIQSWILVLWPLAACLMYALVLFNFRYTAGYIVLLGLGLAIQFLHVFPLAHRARALMFGGSLLVLAGVVTLRPILASAGAPSPTSSVSASGDTPAVSVIIARDLARRGLRPGDEIAVLGRNLDCYYARLAQVRIVAHIWENPDDLEGLPASDVTRVLASLKQMGLKAVISRVKPGFLNDTGWISVPGTDVFIRML